MRQMPGKFAVLTEQGEDPSLREGNMEKAVEKPFDEKPGKGRKDKG